MSIIAKPVIDRKFWILQEGNKKIGNVEACDGGFQVKINNQVTQFKTIKMVEQRIHVQFEQFIKYKPKPVTNLVHGYPVAGRLYNPIWDVTNKLPLYTKTNKSKSWFAAGWYQVKKGRKWQVVQGPKLIVLQRYANHGPFYTREEAEQHDKSI
jgi:1,4-dihydroxy-2-naphthoyl-CoA synthase